MTNSDAPKAPSFRKLAKEHALAAHNFIERAGELGISSPANDVDELRMQLFDWAQVHALVSLACSEVAPPERRACTSRTVDLAAPAVK